MVSCERLEVCESLDPEELEEKAKKIGAFNSSAITTGNTIAVFAMLVLQEILEQQARNPINNLHTIITLSNSIAMLNTSIKIV